MLFVHFVANHLDFGVRHCTIVIGLINIKVAISVADNVVADMERKFKLEKFNIIQSHD